MFGLDNTLVGITVLLAGILMVVDYVMRDNDKKNSEKIQDKFRQEIERNKALIALLKDLDPNEEYKVEPTSSTNRICRKIAKILVQDPLADIELLIKQFHLENEPSGVIKRDICIFLYKEQLLQIKSGNKTSIVKNIILFLRDFLLFIGIVFIMWGLALIFL